MRRKLEGDTLASTLDRQSILELIQGPQTLVEGYLDLEAQLQTNGLDLTLKEVRRFTSPGAMEAGAGPSTLSESTALAFDSDAYVHLSPGGYLITLNEIINLPRDLMALARPRSSLLRSGVAVHTAVWDAGYHGRSQALLVVYNTDGYKLARDARVLQLVFLPLVKAVEEGYKGRYFGENIK